MKRLDDRASAGTEPDDGSAYDAGASPGTDATIDVRLSVQTGAGAAVAVADSHELHLHVDSCPAPMGAACASTAAGLGEESCCATTLRPLRW